MKTDKRFSTNQERLKNRPALLKELGSAFSKKDAVEWLDMFQEAGLPSGPINTVPEVFQHPQREARGLVQEAEHSSAGLINLTGFPYKLSRTPAEIHHLPPRLGEHNQEILVDVLGYTGKEVATFQEKGII